MVRMVTVIAFFALTATASAVPDCPDAQPSRTVLAGQGILESVVAGPDGKLYFTDTDTRALMRLDSPGAPPTVVADGIESPGGLLVGTENDISSGRPSASGRGHLIVAMATASNRASRAT